MNNFFICNESFFEFQKNDILKCIFNKPFACDLSLNLPGMYLNPSANCRISDFAFISDLISKFLPLKITQQLNSLVDSYRNKEKLMFETTQFYRDNLSHMVKVSIIGYEIFNLKFNLNGKKLLIDYFSELEGLDIDDILKVWFLTSLFHDIGQPIDIFTKPPTHEIDKFINIDLLEIKSKPPEIGLNEGDKFINFLSETIKDNLILSKIKDYIERGGSTDHGVVSSYILYGITEKEGLLKEKYYKKLIQLACRMILFHTCFEKIEWGDEFFSIVEFPLDFYLYLIDKIHECGRKGKDMKTSKFRLLEILESQDFFYSCEHNYIANIYEFLDEEALNDAGFKHKKHLKDKSDGVSRMPKFLKMFKRDSINLPEIIFRYKYLDTDTGKKKKYWLKF